MQSIYTRYPDPLTVKINLDPPVFGKPVEFDVSGVVKNNNITAHETVLEIKFTDDHQFPLIKDYAQDFNKPVLAGGRFRITAPNVPTPNNFTDAYFVEVFVGNPTMIPEKPILIFGCAIAHVQNT